MRFSAHGVLIAVAAVLRWLMSCVAKHASCFQFPLVTKHNMALRGATLSTRGDGITAGDILLVFLSTLPFREVSWEMIF